MQLLRCFVLFDLWYRLCFAVVVAHHSKSLDRRLSYWIAVLTTFPGKRKKLSSTLLSCWHRPGPDSNRRSRRK
ncbi:hypothetical protein F5Y10DRAFT_257912 [Nemania abortiva]|nr:hypothetical protein F5Y10DRAFT_257912 [Nemania abortiva]